MVDWGIARWSWNYRENGLGKEKSENAMYTDLFGAEIGTELALLTAQEENYFNRQNLLQWMCPSSATDELPAPADKQFQPRPDFSWKDAYKDPRPEMLVTIGKADTLMGEMGRHFIRFLMRMKCRPLSPIKVSAFPICTSISGRGSL